MDEFENVTVTCKANIYFDGGVTSRTLKFSNGNIKTLGIMQPGEYQFDTEKKEIMEIQSGEVEVLLPDESDWQTFSAGSSFEVKENSKFQIRVHSLADYCCSFVD